MKIIVRLAEMKDLLQIVGVVREVFFHDCCFDEEFNVHEAEYLFSRAIEDKNELLAVATIIDGDIEKIVGFVFYQNKPPTNGEIYLNMIGVARAYQGLGIGLRLLIEGDNLAVKYFRDVRRCRIATIHLSTSKDNPVGQKLYLKGGYEVRGEIIGMVGAGNVEVQMIKDIDHSVQYRQGLWNDVTLQANNTD
ncbi:hypothetical protein COT97_02945 [Candidatus Falkowbacteria bacterium CG10_big_fil_rev_8_21_14_0_10_39_11]|uniref:N-acetyltransferase domain-containing protein n=1 Tax=Candidatus Falkowbacteria bacterium CG10_big_fil_rev_8_21_14_0_10_39_11 TaxID=1974565 RepID=A0A2H0V504_9BACT|nr:MAG: hypothetical protein COT97_02945 [Candidatus Falkowbacteria bacterium CG10_big_fil_rev_8_21_14_0_10_39_11]